MSFDENTGPEDSNVAVADAQQEATPQAVAESTASTLVNELTADAKQSGNLESWTYHICRC